MPIYSEKGKTYKGNIKPYIQVIHEKSSASTEALLKKVSKLTLPPIPKIRGIDNLHNELRKEAIKCYGRNDFEDPTYSRQKEEFRGVLKSYLKEDKIDTRNPSRSVCKANAYKSDNPQSDTQIDKKSTKLPLNFPKSDELIQN